MITWHKLCYNRVFKPKELTVRKLIINLVVSIAALAALLILMPDAKASARLDAAIDKCASNAVWKGAGWSAIYGGGVLGIGAAISVATAPVSIPVGIATGIVAANAVTGGLIGFGSSMVTRLSDINTFDRDPLVISCVAQKAATTTKETIESFKNLLPL